MKKSNFLLVGCLLVVLIFGCQRSIEVTTSSEEALQYYKEGEELRFKLYYNDAISSYRKALQLDSTFALAALRVSYIQYSLGADDSAKFYIEMAKELSENVSDFEKLLVSKYRAEIYGKHELAKAVLDTLLKKYRGNLEVKMLLAGEKWRLLDYDGAIKIYKDILNQNPDFIVIYNNVGYLYASKGLFKEAIKYLKSYMELAPDQINPYDSLAEIYIVIGKYDKAIELIEKTLELNSADKNEPDFLNVSLYLNLANAYKFLGQYKTALSITEKALAICPSEYSLQRVIANRFFLFKELEQINEMDYELSRILGKGDDDYNLMLEGLLNIERGNLSESLKMLSELQKRSKEENDSNIKRNLLILSTYLEGELNLKSGFYDEAAELFKLSASTMGDIARSFPVYLKQYITLGKAGNYWVAIDGLNELLKINPSHPEVLLFISKFYLKSGREAESNSYLKLLKYLWKEADPDSPIMKEIDLISEKIT